MLQTPKKNLYALRAILELAKRVGEGPTKISTIAQAQSIPLRFLEVILSQLKGSGLLDSKRGYTGGYYLLKSPDQITVGEVLRFLQGEDNPIHKIFCMTKEKCPFQCDCAFVPMWLKVYNAIFKIYNETTFEDLLQNESFEPISRQMM